jgi:hypothetical protein
LLAYTSNEMLKYGVWCMVYGVEYGVWCMVYGVWCMVYGVEYEVCSVDDTLF